MEQKLIKSMTGYKATKADMTCQGFQFKLGEWFEYKGDLSLCKSGFHFCKYPSGPWAYYTEKGTRIFKVEAEDVLESPIEPGADAKFVCRRIRLTEEVRIGGDNNTGNWNTGNRNTGDWNTGNWNTGNRNTGDWNTGNRNTGYGNTGYGNTGDRNTGYGNTGNRNTGDWNTGYGNVGNYHSGFFSTRPEKVISFDVQTKYTREQFEKRYGNLVYELGEALLQQTPISFGRFKKLPGITKKKLEKLHKAHMEARVSTELLGGVK